MKFTEFSPAQAEKLNVFDLIGKKWMLVTAGNQENFNTMTASWGSLGVLWNKNVSFIFIRPQRYTFEFIEKSDYYTLSFFGEDYKKALSFCGSHSGRNIDKSKQAGLVPVFDKEAPYFEQAEIVLVCKKLYAQFIEPSCFYDKSLDKNYENGDYHKMFVGEILRYTVKK